MIMMVERLLAHEDLVMEFWFLEWSPGVAGQANTAS